MRNAFNTRGAELIKEFDVRGVRPGLPIRLLSGGNLQKALIAREVTQDHCVLIARSPTRGLDVGATAVVREQILAERDRGIGVLLISEDLDELLALSDRMLVIYEGKIVGEMPASEATAERLGLAHVRPYRGADCMSRRLIVEPRGLAPWWLKLRHTHRVGARRHDPRSSLPRYHRQRLGRGLSEDGRCRIRIRTWIRRDPRVRHPAHPHRCLRQQSPSRCWSGTSVVKVS